MGRHAIGQRRWSFLDFFSPCLSLRRFWKGPSDFGNFAYNLTRYIKASDSAHLDNVAVARGQAEGERAELWAASVRRYNLKRAEEQQAARLKILMAAEALRYLGTHYPEC